MSAYADFNNMEKKNNHTCLMYFSNAMIVAIIYKVIEFFKRPGAIREIIEFFEVVGICIGSIILLLVCMYIYDKFTTKQNQQILWQNRNYLVRCYPIKLIKTGFRPISDNLPEKAGQENKFPCISIIGLTNYGICISQPTETHNKSEGIPSENLDLISTFVGNKDLPIFLPLGCVKLYYVVYKSKGDLEFEFTPLNLSGYTDESPKIPDGYQIRIVIIFNCFFEKTNLGKANTMEQPIKLELTALNNEGTDDSNATSELYSKIYNNIKSFESDDDDSWMYRSRPMN